MLPITSAEPASRLPGLTDDFDLSKHEDLLAAWSTHPVGLLVKAGREEGGGGMDVGDVEDERLIPILPPP